MAAERMKEVDGRDRPARLSEVKGSDSLLTEEPGNRCGKRVASSVLAILLLIGGYFPPQSRALQASRPYESLRDQPVSPPRINRT